jgi:hypothetical protein
VRWPPFLEQPIERTSIRQAGVIAVTAAALAMTADLILQYTSNRQHLMSRESLYLLDVSPRRLLVGLGVVAILIEIIGFWPVYRALRPADRRYALPFFLVNAFGAMLGAAFHGTFVFVGLTLQLLSKLIGPASQGVADLLASFNAARVGLAIPAIAAIVIGSLQYAFTVAFRRTLYPRWMAVWNPLTFLVLTTLVTLAAPASGLVLAPTALNLSHLLFFSASTAVF